MCCKQLAVAGEDPKEVFVVAAILTHKPDCLRLSFVQRTIGPFDLPVVPRAQIETALWAEHPEIVKQIDAFMKEAYVPNPDWPLMVSEVKK